jgi:hypothetical protein
MTTLTEPFMLRFIKILPKILLIFYTIWIAGCFTILGTEVGSVIDSKTADERVYPGWQVDQVNPGATVNLILTDQFLMAGKFLGMDTIPVTRYRLTYNRKREQLLFEEIFLPELGEKITCYSIPDDIAREGKFLGFNYNAVSISKDEFSNPVWLSFDLIDRLVDVHGNVLSIDTIKKLREENEIPFFTSILIDVGPAERQFSLDEVQQIRVERKKGGKLIGMVLGWSVDFFFFLKIAGSIEND